MVSGSKSTLVTVANRASITKRSISSSLPPTARLKSAQ